MQEIHHAFGAMDPNARTFVTPDGEVVPKRTVTVEEIEWDNPHEWAPYCQHDPNNDKPNVRPLDECVICDVSDDTDDFAEPVQCSGCGRYADASYLNRAHACHRNADGTYEEGGQFL